MTSELDKDIQIVFMDSHYLFVILTPQLNLLIHIQVMLELSNHHALVMSEQSSYRLSGLVIGLSVRPVTGRPVFQSPVKSYQRL